MRPTAAARASRAALALLALHAVLRRSLADDAALPSPSPGDSCATCTTQYRPTCCDVGGTNTTLGSLCACSCVGGAPLNFDPAVCPADNPLGCTYDTDPVCCQMRVDGDLDRLVTMNNPCLCRRSGVIVSNDKCPTEDVCDKVLCQGGTLCSEDPPNTPQCAPFACDCFGEFDPVCCEEFGERFTASNECTCSGCGTGAVLFKGKCPEKPPCSFSPIPKPVCCERPNGSIFTAVNAEACACDGDVILEGECTEDGPKCLGVKCPEGEVCIISDGEPVCLVPGTTCATVECKDGEVCEQRKDGLVCVKSCV